MPPKSKSARQEGRSAAKITKRAPPSSSALSDLAEVSAAQQTAKTCERLGLSERGHNGSDRGPESCWSWANDPISKIHRD